MKTMKCLSVRQPWAWCLANGQKPVENRTWKTNYRGPLAIHAAQRFDYDGLDWILETFGNIFRPGECQAAIGPSWFDTGGIVGRATLAGCVSAHASPWFCGPHGFVLEAARPTVFYKMPGRLGFFDVPEDCVVPGPQERLAVLCQDCLRVRPYTAARHNGEDRCQCGGEFCGCEDCRLTIARLQAGHLTAAATGLRCDLDAWGAVHGCEVSDNDRARTGIGGEPTAAK